MKRFTCSIVVPCFNEEATLRQSVGRLISVFEGDSDTDLQVLIVDDCSTDRSAEIAEQLADRYANVTLLRHPRNRGKGAALRTGFQHATGEFVGVHDADLEYDPRDLKRLLAPLKEDLADVVYGSRFLSGRAHRVLYFWHSVGNKLLTLLSNIFTDLNLTDMETCYKLFRREVLNQIELEEERFGFEPEITAKVAGLRVRVYEVGISYYGRTYEEGKKIGLKDGLHAFYCILRFNGHQAPVGIQFLVYACIGGIAALFNLLIFMALRQGEASVEASAATAFATAAVLNYVLCVWVLFRHQARWRTPTELMVYWVVVAVVGAIDVATTKALIWNGMHEVSAKAISSMVGLILNFAGRRWAVFPEPGRGPWKIQSGGN